MALVGIGIGIGILLVIILIVKADKTSSQDDVLRMDIYCRKCGFKTNGLKCPKCEKRTQAIWCLNCSEIVIYQKRHYNY